MSAGPVAEEAAKLAEALQAWLGAASSSVPLAHDTAECRICPLCQAIRAVRGLRPEVVEHLAAATTELTAALRAAVETTSTPERASRVEKIDIDGA
ncbi:MAG TPA: DUF5304 family protein [Mycobacteriales bacterium]